MTIEVPSEIEEAFDIVFHDENVGYFADIEGRVGVYYCLNDWKDTDEEREYGKKLSRMLSECLDVNISDIHVETLDYFDDTSTRSVYSYFLL
jgi:hypothetical protein